MKIIRHATELPGVPRRVCLAIGVFDGVHLGHQQVIRQTIADASRFEAASVVVTFDRHPNNVVAPHAVPPAIYTLDQKLAAIEELGADATLVIPFDEPFSRRPADDFIRGLRADFGTIQSVCVGREFTFGHRRSGNVALLTELGRRHNFQVHGLSSVALDGDIVSSTRIRGCLQAGDFEGAAQMLGRDYLLVGRVTRGDQLGARLGFPTANIDVAGLATPPTGVYLVHAFANRGCVRGVGNLGVRPTVGASSAVVRLEVHLLDFSGDLYDQTLGVQFIQRLREERKFSSLEELQAQIAHDVDLARRSF